MRKIPELAALLPEQGSTLILPSLPGLEGPRQAIKPLPPSDATQVVPLAEGDAEREDPTVIAEATRPQLEVATAVFQKNRNIASEPTVVFAVSSEPETEESPTARSGPKKFTPARRRQFLIGVVALVGLLLFATEEERPPIQPPVSFRPAFPTPEQVAGDPAKAKKIFEQGLKHYVEDTVLGYQNAAKMFLASANLDFTNLRALGLLASSYIHLVDTTSQDAEYFSIITRLLEIIRGKGPNIPETIIADTEFYQLLGKHDAAIQRINDYTKAYPNYGREMFFYVAEAAFGKGDARLAAKMLAEVSEKSAFSPKVFYLRALIADSLGETETALQELRRALSVKSEHAKSRLKIAEILASSGRLKEAGPELEFLVQNPQLLAPQPLGRAYYLHARYLMLSERWKAASEDLERAVALDKSKRDYAIEYFSVLGRLGGLTAQMKRKAQMYVLLGEGEKKFADEEYEKALALFLRAQEVDNDSYLPALRLGETFLKLYQTEEALQSFRRAYGSEPRRVEVATRLCKTLIDTYSWEEARGVIQKLGQMPGGRSASDKLLGDLYAKQKLYADALIHYRRAMTRETIDPELYNAYARALMDAQSPEHAPMFFGLARRFDPKNPDAIVGTAEAMAVNDGTEQAIRFLRRELETTQTPRPEFLATIAMLHSQKGDWKEAQRIAQQVVTDYPGYARGYWILGQVHWKNKELSRDRYANAKAIQAFRRYSERNPSDPSGYLELYKIFLEQKKYELAEQELQSVIDRYPKFPGIFVSRGDLYTLWGNLIRASQEYQREIQNHPNSAVAYLSLGRSYLEMQKFDDALKQFAEAMKNAPKAAEPRYYAGYAQYLLKNFSGAVAMLSSAAQIDQGNPLIYKRLGDAYVATGQMTQAQEAYRRYLSLAPDAPDKAEVEKFL